MCLLTVCGLPTWCSGRRIRLPMQGPWDRSLGQENPLEEEMTTTPVFLPGEFHRQRSLVGYSPWGHKESDTVEWHSWQFVYFWRIIRSFAHFLIELFVFLLLSSLYILWSSSYQAYDLQHFLPFTFYFLNGIFWSIKVFHFNKVQFFNFFFGCLCFWCHILRNHHLTQVTKICLICLFCLRYF